MLLNSDVCGIDTIPPPSKIDTLHNIMKLKSPSGSEWNVFAYVLNLDMIGPDGKLDDLHAYVFPLGSYDKEEKASKHVEKVILETGHSGVCYAEYGAPVPLNTKPDIKTISKITVDTEGKLKKLESAQYKRDRDVYEKRQIIEREMMKEAREETNPDSIEYFKRQCFLAVKHKTTYEANKKETETSWKNYKMRTKLLQEHYSKYPEHEVQWLPYLKEKLIERGESDQYYFIESGYNKYRDELLGISSTEPNVYDLHKQIVEQQKIINDLTNKLSVGAL